MNDEFSFNVTANGNITKHTVTIPPGKYSRASLVNTLNSLFDAVGAPVKASISTALVGDDQPISALYLTYDSAEPATGIFIDAVAGSASHLIFYPSSTDRTLYTSESLVFQVGANSNQNLSAGIPIPLNLWMLGIDTLEVTSQRLANISIAKVDNSVSLISEKQTEIGTIENILDLALYNAGTAELSMVSAESKMIDLNMAKEALTLTKNQLLLQANQALMAQANSTPQNVLFLLRNV
jgi:flagellin